ncbi:hypothetical protein ACFFVJ_01660 [Roseibium salinum]
MTMSLSLCSLAAKDMALMPDFLPWDNNVCDGDQIHYAAIRPEI